MGVSEVAGGAVAIPREDWDVSWQVSAMVSRELAGRELAAAGVSVVADTAVVELEEAAAGVEESMSMMVINRSPVDESMSIGERAETEARDINVVFFSVVMLVDACVPLGDNFDIIVNRSLFSSCAMKRDKTHRNDMKGPSC